jgi:hypothetical protein
VGSVGPLCGSCDVNYVYRSAKNKCEKCDQAQFSSYVVIGVLVVFVMFVAIYMKRGHNFDIRNVSLIQFLLHIDGGSLKVIYIF